MSRVEITAMGRPTTVTATSRMAMNEAMIMTNPRKVLSKSRASHLAVHSQEDAGQILDQNQSQNEVAQDGQQAEDVKARLIILSLIRLIFYLVEVYLSRRAGVIELIGTDGEGAVDPSRVNHLAAADESISFNRLAGKYVHLAASSHQIGADVAAQVDISAGSYNLSTHISVDIDLAPGSDDVALHRGIDVHSAARNYGRVHRGIDAHHVARRDDIVGNSRVYGDCISGKSLQCLPCRAEQNNSNQNENCFNTLHPIHRN